MSNKGKAKWNILRYKAFHSSRSVEKCYKGGSLSPIDGATESLSNPSAICRRFPEAVNGIGGAAGQLAIVGIIQNLLLSHYSNSHPQALSSHIIQNLLPSHYSKPPLHALSSPIFQNLPLSRYSNRLSVHYFDFSASPSRDQIFFTSLFIQAFPSYYQIQVRSFKKSSPSALLPTGNSILQSRKLLICFLLTMRPSSVRALPLCSINWPFETSESKIVHVCWRREMLIRKCLGSFFQPIYFQMWSLKSKYHVRRSSLL